MSIRVAVGVDIGGTGTQLGLVGEDGKILVEGAVNTRLRTNFSDFVKDVVDQINTCTSTNPEYEIIGIGIGAPNGNGRTNMIVDAPNLPWSGDLPIVEEFKTYFDVPIYLSNDANAAAIGEMMFGGAQNMQDFIMITLGTGLGSGIVTGGQLILGKDGLGAELGHNMLKRGKGRKCNCGRRGCLETYVSATGIKRTVFKLLADSNQPSTLRKVSFEDLETVDIYNAAKQVDLMAKEAFDYTGKILGLELANVVALFNPEAIFLFGGLALSEDYIFNPTKAHLEKNLMDMHKGSVSVLPSSLSNKGTAVIGAAALVFRNN